MGDRRLPDKAIDVIDEVGALQQILPKSKRKINIGVADIENIVAKLARIPSRQVNSDDKSQLKNLEEELKLGVFGQDSAVESLIECYKAISFWTFSYSNNPWVHFYLLAQLV